jgi:hypothetical protein
MTSLTSEKLEFSDGISLKTLYTSIYKTRCKTLVSLSRYMLKANQCTSAAVSLVGEPNNNKKENSLPRRSHWWG